MPPAGPRPTRCSQLRKKQSFEVSGQTMGHGPPHTPPPPPLAARAGWLARILSGKENHPAWQTHRMTREMHFFDL